MINALSAGQIYTQGVDVKSSRVDAKVKTSKIESSKVEDIKNQIAKGEYKLDMKATASSMLESIF